MANKKQPYSWNRVKPGDIVSFRYKSTLTGKMRVNTVLVLNPKLSVRRKDGSPTRHFIGIKLEESNKIQLRINQRQLMLLEKIGTFRQIDEKNNLYRLDIDRRFIVNDIKGIKKAAYDKIARSLGIEGQYRTYDWLRTKQSAVYLEPIRIFTTEYEGEDVKSVNKIVPKKDNKK